MIPQSYLSFTGRGPTVAKSEEEHKTGDLTFFTKRSSATLRNAVIDVILSTLAALWSWSLSEKSCVREQVRFASVQDVDAIWNAVSYL